MTDRGRRVAVAWLTIVALASLVPVIQRVVERVGR
jgi:hypothetical protein